MPPPYHPPDIFHLQDMNMTECKDASEDKEDDGG